MQTGIQGSTSDHPAVVKKEVLFGKGEKRGCGGGGGRRKAEGGRVLRCSDQTEQANTLPFFFSYYRVCALPSRTAISRGQISGVQANLWLTMLTTLDMAFHALLRPGMTAGELHISFRPHAHAAMQATGEVRFKWQLPTPCSPIHTASEGGRDSEEPIFPWSVNLPALRSWTL